MYLKVEHQKGNFYFNFDCESRFFAYRYVLGIFEKLQLEAPLAFKIMKTGGASLLGLTVMPPYVKEDGKYLPVYNAPPEEWTVIASEEAQLRMGVPKHLVEAQKVLAEAILAREWPRE